MGSKSLHFRAAETAFPASERIYDSLQWVGGAPSAYRDQLEVCDGDITDPASLDSVGARRQLSACTTVIHSAADTRFVLRQDGQPWKTNYDGTRNLFNRIGSYCRDWIQVSTAYTSPVQDGIGSESLTAPTRFRNAYEESKHTTDNWLQKQADARGMRLVVARPGIIVGEHTTGKTCSYDGFYGPMQMLATLIRRADRQSNGLVHLPLRYDVARDGVRNLVPVDWVSKTIHALAETSKADGVFHLTPRQATTNEVIDDAMCDLWRVDRTEFVSQLPADQRSALEKLFYRSIERIAPSWYNEPVYDTQRLETCLPESPCPVIDYPAVIRFLKYAQAADWGKQASAHVPTVNINAARFDCRYFLEEFLPTWATQSALPRLEDLTAQIGFTISGAGGGGWVCKLVNGNVDSVVPGDADCQQVSFATDTDTFRAIVEGDVSTQAAFFQRRVEIRGQIETGLKLAMIFQQFIREFPFRELAHREAGYGKAV